MTVKEAACKIDNARNMVRNIRNCALSSKFEYTLDAAEMDLISELLSDIIDILEKKEITF